MAESQTSQAWERIAEKHAMERRLANGEVVALTAQEIKDVGGREPRLMTKFDTRESRPRQLANATVLPLSNGAYVVLPGDGYHDLPVDASVKTWPIPHAAAALRTLPWALGPSSESQALDMAMAAGVLADFVNDPKLYLTIRGRRRSPQFEFDFRCRDRTERLRVDGVQIEVDSGLEGDAIHLLEGKLGSRDNFHIRQLYYPLRMWKQEVPEKDVNAVFMSWSNRRFALRRFVFEPLDGYHAIRLAHSVDYVLDAVDALPTVAELLSQTVEEGLPDDVPFPQADDLRRVVDVVDAVANGHDSQGEIAAVYDFDLRQADYYGNAAAFLGLLERGRRAFALSELGRNFVVSPLTRRNLVLGQRVVSFPVFRQAVEWLADNPNPPDYANVVDWLAVATPLTGATLRRRASTVIAWCRWVSATFAR